MSETAGTIIKLLAALTSPKACVKYITVAVTLLISWKYLEPIISETQISKEQLSIILLLLGVGCGSLVGQVISWSIEYLWKLHKSKKEADLNQKLELEKAEIQRIEEEEKQKRLLKKIQSSFEHLHFEQKATLRKLTLKNETLNMSDLSNSALEENGYVQRLVHVRVSNYLTQINPLISDFVKKQWAAEKELKVKEFLQYNEHAEKLLELLEEKNRGKELSVEKEVLASTSRYSGCVQGDDDDREDSTGYWLWFEDYLLEEFEKQTGKSYIDEVFISLQRITAHEVTA
ncbi:hypothetical protein MIB92_14690 [Aestuariirhabdus sp. Z084]|uniref:hypothetical protein n=1 Tax=Aestuariirhabdus haliotis TaxID=2918751 RepID=UPI00201B4378|nr:hypothetical protein [Aestuariirhabdus haliotis]MCL6416906.1 hypothetical protein [Aestuariirhabdus haliotis]MCL6420932.1 hypothetical protein [Aestuariirhabdus haliotis]